MNIGSYQHRTIVDAGGFVYVGKQYPASKFDMAINRLVRDLNPSLMNPFWDSHISISRRQKNASSNN